MANENMKNETVNNENTQEVKEQENTNPAPETNEEVKKDGIFKKGINAVKKNGKKIAGVGLGLAAVAAGIVIGDKFGIPGFKKGGDEPQETTEQQ